MESQSSSFLVITFFLSFFILWLARKYKQNTRVTHKLPPGPWKLPLIGNLHQLAAASASSPPHHALRKLSQKFGPLMHLQFGEISAVVASCPDTAKQIMKTHDLAFAHRPHLLSAEILAYGSMDIAFAPYGEYWRQMKKICTLELLSAKRVQSFSYIREDENGKLIQSIRSSSGSPLNLSSMLVNLTSTVVSRVVFGKISKEQEEFVSAVKEAIQVSDGFDVADLFPSLKPVHDLMSGIMTKLDKIRRKRDKVLDKIIAENQEKVRTRKQNMQSEAEAGDENLVEVLLRVQQSGNLDIPITINSIKAVIWDMFAAGTDSSATVLEWAMSELMKNPRVREKAQAEVRQAFRGKETIHESDVSELNYLKSIIKETLRLHPPGPLLVPRECKEACKINGYEIPIKTHVMVNAWAIGRDPKHWHEAERFMPERFHDSNIDFRGTNFEYIPFGAGRRMCPGISFGLANVELPLAKLLYHFDWQLPNGMKADDLDMAETFGAVAGRKNNLYLIPIPYEL
ncbi:cytochrome P450 71D8-like [Senna tora]|uniref:Cytochrome P450 71D8-like n=1 Tax=Senna tora TaxID=362788 RepID=A0A834W2Y2_9FABA|nr:cytochrome P450 71D8-like [Senna tora]